jgi:UDP-N-acetylglucosamine--N-acetylmuramyl-(pentapeptide) pyrophosphoryl-undecaprenol N-acetylglucosamine transferase
MTTEQKKKNTKILITGGHLTPAIITAKELLENGYSNIIWVGRKYTQAGDTATSPEYQLVDELKLQFIHFVSGKLWRKWNKYTYVNAIKDLLLIPFGFISSFIIIIKHKPQIIVTFGGYVGLPFAIAGKLTGKKIIVHEQGIRPGLANRIIAKLSNKVLISWKNSEKYFTNKNLVLTGNPSWVLYYKTTDTTKLFANEKPIISIFGGNQGAHVINTAIFALLEEILKFSNVIHQTGRSEVTKDKYKASEIKSQLDKKYSDNYLFYPYVTNEDNYKIYKNSDLMITRGGANTMTDLIAMNKKSIIIPIPFSAGNEQLINAQFMEKLGLSTIIQYKSELNPEELLKEIKSSLNKEFNPEKNEIKELQTLIRYSPVKIYHEIENML